MSATAIPFLRPLGVAELLDATIRLYRKNFWTFVAIVAVVHVPLLVINGALSVPMSLAVQEMQTFNPYTFDPETFDPETFDPERRPSLFPPSFGRYLLWAGIQLLVSASLGLVATALMTGALAWAVSERHLERPVTVGRAYRAVLRRWKPLLGATLLTLGIYLVLYIVLVVPCIGQIVGIPALIFTYVCLRFVPQAVLLEEQRAGDSLRRSWFLAKPHFWRVAGIIALLFLLGLLITAGPSYIVNFGIVAANIPLVLRTLITTVIGALLGLLYLPIRLTGETVLYYDLRVRAEGLDLEMEVDALALPTAPDLDDLLGLEPVTARQPTLPPAPIAHEPFLTRRDWRNLAILVGVGVGLLAICCILYLGFVALITAVSAPMMEQILESLPTLTPTP